MDVCERREESPGYASLVETQRARILIVDRVERPDSLVDDLRQSTPEADYVAVTEQSLYEHAQSVDAIVGCHGPVLTDAILDRAGSRLRWVHARTAGVDQFRLPRFLKSDIVFTNGKVIQGPAAADHALALLLALSRSLHFAIRGAAVPIPGPIELRGKTMVVVGLGGIGALVAERAAAFGMRVIGVDPAPIPMLRCIERVVPPDELEDVLPAADAVVVAAPLTELTLERFGEKQFSRMKRSAYFVVVSRGRTVRTPDLVHALREGQIAGAGLDVTSPEPLPADHPLLSMYNVIVTPHIAGFSEYRRQRSNELIKLQVARFVRGLPLMNVVDKRLGY